MNARSNITLRSPDLSVQVSPVGAELQRVATAAGEDLLWDGDPSVWAGRAPVLFPIVGMLSAGTYRLGSRDFAMPKHGFARHAIFSVVAHTDASLGLRLVATAQTRAIYPFEFQLDVTFSLAGPQLTVAAVVSNLGQADMPASLGFHPALRRPLPFGQPRDDHRLVFDRDEPAPFRRIDSAGLMTHERYETPIVDRVLTLSDDLFVDDALIFDRIASRRLSYGSAAGPQISVEFDDFSILGVWSKLGADFICIEPWASLPDPVGFKGELWDKPGVFCVPPGGSRRQAMCLTWEP